MLPWIGARRRRHGGNADQARSFGYGEVFPHSNIAARSKWRLSDEREFAAIFAASRVPSAANNPKNRLGLMGRLTFGLTAVYVVLRFLCVAAPLGRGAAR
jgi:hypothetical protein